MHAAVRAELVELRESLADDDEQRAEGDDDEEPRRQREVRRHAAGDRAQHEPRGDEPELDHREPLGAERVARRTRRCRGRRRRPSSQRSAKPIPSPMSEEGDRRRHGGVDRHRAHGDRPGALAGMEAVRVAVPDVVQQVGPRGGRAERDERDGGPRRHVAVEELPGRDRGDDDEEALHPLPRPHRDEQAERRGHRRGRGDLGVEGVCGAILHDDDDATCTRPSSEGRRGGGPMLWRRAPPLSRRRRQTGARRPRPGREGDRACAARRGVRGRLHGSAPDARADRGRRRPGGRRRPRPLDALRRAPHARPAG